MTKMKIKAFHKLLLPAIALITLMTGCRNDDRETEPLPDYGTLASLTTVWDRRSEEVKIPDNYVLTTVHAASEHSYSATLKGTETAIDHQFPAGRHAIHIYNVADNISVSGMKATVDYQSGRPGWFFAGTGTLDIEKGGKHSVTVDMKQMLRELKLRLYVGGDGDSRSRLKGITAVVGGIAEEMNLETLEPTGQATSVATVFEKSGLRADGDLWEASMRLAGIIGNVQTLTLTLTFDDGSTVILEKEAGEAMKDFGSAYGSLALEAKVELESDEPPAPEPVSLLAVTAPTFAPLTEGYAQPSARPLIIANTGNAGAIIRGVSVSPTTAFETGGSGSRVAAGESIDSWTVRPKAGLEAGTYRATVTVAYDGKTATARVEITVSPASTVEPEPTPEPEPEPGPTPEPEPEPTPDPNPEPSASVGIRATITDWVNAGTETVNAQ